ncbi:MAG: LptF/LptG family permease [Treponema sp.]|jgi:hypothetical protein|nr:LptF/LptG family permease [Treponema sp.]
MKLNRETVLSPPGIFIIYVLASSLVIMAYTFIFPGETSPIPWFAFTWRFVRGFLRILDLYPALALTGLVIPFGVLSSFVEGYGSFSAKFLDRLKGPLFTAIAASALYGALCFIPLPLLQDAQANMRFEGELYRLSREKARENGTAGNWEDAAYFIAVCERIWPESPELERLKSDVSIRLERLRFEEAERRREASGQAAGTVGRTGMAAGGAAAPDSGIPRPVNAAEALLYAGEAMNAERYYNAHWLAVLAGRLAGEGSPEAAEAARMAGRAWDAVMSLAPGAREREAYFLYRLKNSGYQAMVGGDWIRAYYIFRELLDLAPSDPDAANYLARSEQGTLETAFFTDEMDLALGEILTGAVFSLPSGFTDLGNHPEAGWADPAGRAALRFSSLAASSDYSYGTGLEYIGVDGEGRLTRVEAPYAKILPITLDSRPRTLVLMQALDRHDGEKRWEPVWSGAPPSAENVRLILELSYDNFLLLAQARRGLDNLFTGELWDAAENLEMYGYIPEVFQAELASRFAKPLFFLPLTIAVLILGWRLRARKRPRYFFIPMLFVSPLVFYGVVSFFGTFLDTLGIWMVVYMGFTAAASALALGIAVFFVLDLVVLAAQR